MGSLPGALAVLAVSFLVRGSVRCVHRCGQDVCRDEQTCCPRGGHNNNTSSSSVLTCCGRQGAGPYYNIAMVTRKLSGVLILLLLFALGYSLQRVLCTRTGRLVQGQGGRPPVTTSRDPLMEGGSPDRTPAPRLPSYDDDDDSKRLPTYEETMREDAGAD